MDFIFDEGNFPVLKSYVSRPNWASCKNAIFGPPARSRTCDSAGIVHFAANRAAKIARPRVLYVHNGSNSSELENVDRVSES